VEQHRTEDRRKPWDGSERRGCYFDPDAFAERVAPDIAAHLDAHQAQRDQLREDARYAAIGRAVVRRLIYVVGAGGLYAIGRQHEALMGFVTWVFKNGG